MTKMKRFIDEVMEVRKALSAIFPRVIFFEGNHCLKCNDTTSLYYVIDPSTGTPKNRFACTLFSSGDTTSRFFDGGILPMDDGIHDMGGGCFVGSAHFTWDALDRDAMAAKLTELASTIAAREREFMAEQLSQVAA